MYTKGVLSCLLAVCLGMPWSNPNAWALENGPLPEAFPPQSSKQAKNQTNSDDSSDPLPGETAGVPSFELNSAASQAPLPEEPPPGMAIIVDPETGERKLAPMIEVDPPPEPESAPPGMVIITDPVTKEKKIAPILNLKPNTPKKK